MDTLIKIPIAGTMTAALAALRDIHERDTMRAWRSIGGSDLRSWMRGGVLIVGNEDGPTSARATLGTREVIVSAEGDAESYFAVAVIKAAIDASERG